SIGTSAVNRGGRNWWRVVVSGSVNCNGEGEGRAQRENREREREREREVKVKNQIFNLTLLEIFTSLQQN
ncbi:hypothetical protein ACOSB0_00290, partial [Candidatus Phytoplasma citri]